MARVHEEARARLPRLFAHKGSFVLLSGWTPSSSRHPSCPVKFCRSQILSGGFAVIESLPAASWFEWMTLPVCYEQQLHGSHITSYVICMKVINPKLF